jgi:hypothetical protein
MLAPTNSRTDMLSASMHRKQTFAKFSIVGIDRVRALIAVGGFIGLCLVVFVVGAGAHFFGSSKAPPPAMSTQQGEAIHRQGAIMFTPQHGHTCWQRRFDNLSGQVVSDRVVECPGEVVTERVKPERHDNTVRIRAIMKDFKQRK